MLPLILIFCMLFGFLLTYWITPWLIRYLYRIELLVQDQHKENKKLVPVSGGIAILLGILAGLMIFIFFRTFFPNTVPLSLLEGTDLTLIFAALITIFTITFVGFIDDLLIRKSKTSSAGLKQWQKPLLTLAAAVPLMVSQVGTTVMIVPFVGHVDFGLFYPLLLVPLAVVFGANMVNILAGFNGMETGMGIIYMLSLGSYAYYHGRYTAALIALVTFAALLAFYLYNKTPATIIPGDSGTYLLGAALVTVAVLGNLEKAALIISIPFIIEFILKARGKFRKVTVGYLENGKIKSHYKKIYSIPHFFTRTGTYTEKQIVYFMFFIQLIFSGLIWVL